jgi:hypothetical protein
VLCAWVLQCFVFPFSKGKVDLDCYTPFALQALPMGKMLPAVGKYFLFLFDLIIM